MYKGNNVVNRDLKEIEDLFYTIKVVVERENYLDTQNRFKSLLFSKDYKYYTNEQISLLIDKFFGNYKYANYESLYEMYKLIYKFFSNLIKKFMINCLKYGNILILDNECEDVINNCNNVKIDKELIREIIDDCIDDTRIINLLYVKSKFSDDLELCSKINKIIKLNEKENLFQLFNDINSVYYWYIKSDNILNKYDIERLNNIYEFIYLVIKDICRNEEKDIGDIELLGSGGYSVVVGIGNKVLKLGGIRETESFPNNPYVIPMLLRKELAVNDDIYFFVEVTERCKNNIEVSDEEWENFLDKLYGIGIEWEDAKECNLGRVSNPNGNVISWRENLYVSDEVLGLDPYRGEEVLKQGDLVILDNDWLYDINEHNFVNWNSSSSRSR